MTAAIFVSSRTALDSKPANCNQSVNQSINRVTINYIFLNLRWKL